MFSYGLVVWWFSGLVSACPGVGLGEEGVG